MIEEKKSKFLRFAEVLPNNENTAKILKEREEIAQAKADREKAVSPPHLQFQKSLSTLLNFLIQTCL